MVLLPLDKYGRPILSLQDLLGLPHRELKRGREWRLSCPLHAGQNPSSFVVDLVSGLYFCYSCGGKGKLKEYWEERQTQTSQECPSSSSIASKQSISSSNLQATSPLTAKRVTFSPAVAPFPDLIPRQGASNLSLLSNFTITPAPEFEGKRVKRLQTFLARRRPLLPSAQEYLSFRGIKLSTAQRLGLAYEPHYRFNFLSENNLLSQYYYCPALFSPLNNSQGLTNYYARGLDPRRLHHLPPGEKGLFIPPNLTSPERQPLVMVEGTFDALAVVESGYPAAVALIGATLPRSGWWLETDQIVLALDRDETGRQQTPKLAQQLTNLGLKVKLLPEEAWRGAKDLAEAWQLHPGNWNWSQHLRRAKEWENQP